LEISKNDREDTYRQAVKLFGSGDVDLAYVKFAGLLNENFDDAKALYGLGRIYREAEHYGLAFNLFRVCAGFRKMGAGPWNEMGLCQAETYDLDVALNCFRRALQIDPQDTRFGESVSSTPSEVRAGKGFAIWKNGSGGPP
jgi:tetratricopeptide (TPR) repeat protein